MPKKVKWLESPEAQDYPSAADYLHLLLQAESVDATVQALQDTPITTQKAKDILRAAGLPLLDVTNPHVASDLLKIRTGVKLSPILLVRGNLSSAVPLHIADGYHRVCATYHTDENTNIPVQLADLILGRPAVP
ncbi:MULTISPECIES: hypothetical protein [unclassified Cryobacterium]|uniref:hypothetical protein n=2 Tax=Cryobacterium TaxID=69578 RepID=UPI002AB37066|nr:MULTISPECIES: hypothetical protein [unclassified Cryobacterium]MDY7528898.1 hypothetical protein [Cryobacterium sp. 10C2]MDY7558936.1 hypothetical protein [Cryobacterium sp. 10C3]MEB0200707.1 hypothetical protein [Cryobacterium sp. 5I3]